MNLKVTAAIAACKLVRLTARILKKGGTAKPGEIALKICPDLLRIVSRGVETVVVTGTNGKTSSCRMLEQAFAEAGVSCVVNRSGANLMSGIVTEFVMDCDLRDHPLNVGDIVSEAETVSILENNTFLNERNTALLRLLNSKYANSPIPAQVKAVFDQMKKFGIIAETIDGSRRFQFTGKLEYIYEVLEFINSREQILEKNTDEQTLALQGDVFNG